MAKLSNGTEITNPYFNTDFAEYLLNNHINVCKHKEVIEFYNHKFKLKVKGDCVDLWVFHPETPFPSPMDWVYTQSHHGISQLNLFTWILLMHVMGVVTIPEFLKNARNSSDQDFVEASFITKQLLHLPIKEMSHA